MKSNGITLASSPQRGSVEITYDELEVSNARRFVALYIDADAPEYDGDLDGGKLPEDILAAAIAFNRALQVLHFVPERSIVWLVDNVPGVTDETVRQYAERALGMDRVESPAAAARERMLGRRADAAAAVGKYSKEELLGAAINAFVAEGDLGELGRAIYEQSSLGSEQLSEVLGDLACWQETAVEDEVTKARLAEPA